MRFVIAACAACLILLCDLDPSRSHQTPTLQDARPRDIRPLPSASLADLFLENLEAIARANARSEHEAAIEQTDVTEAAEQPSPSPSDRFCHALREAADASGIPAPFFARLIWQESRFRFDEISHAGAQGVAQFMPETALEVGLDDPFDPFKALPASARLLRKLRDDFGNLGLAAAAYNAGSGRIQKWLARQSDLPRETRDYVRIITGTRAEDWIEDADLLAIRTDLPPDAPCEGIGGLSKSKDVAFVSASPAPAVIMVIRNAEAAQLAARLAAIRSRQRLALLLRKSATSSRTAQRGRARHMIAARTTPKRASSGAIRLASRDRPSS